MKKIVKVFLGTVLLLIAIGTRLKVVDSHFCLKQKKD